MCPTPPRESSRKRQVDTGQANKELGPVGQGGCLGECPLASAGGRRVPGRPGGGQGRSKACRGRHVRKWRLRGIPSASFLSAPCGPALSLGPGTRRAGFRPGCHKLEPTLSIAVAQGGEQREPKRGKRQTFQRRWAALCRAGRSVMPCHGCEASGREDNGEMTHLEPPSNGH